MKKLLTGKNFSFLLVATLFCLIPPKSEVENLLTQLVRQYQIPTGLQWLILVFLAFLPLIVLMIPLFRSAQETIATQTQNQLYLELTGLSMGTLLLVGYCTTRLLFWLA